MCVCMPAQVVTDHVIVKALVGWKVHVVFTHSQMPLPNYSSAIAYTFEHFSYCHFIQWETCIHTIYYTHLDDDTFSCPKFHMCIVRLEIGTPHYSGHYPNTRCSPVRSGYIVKLIPLHCAHTISISIATCTLYTWTYTLYTWAYTLYTWAYTLYTWTYTLYTWAPGLCSYLQCVQDQILLDIHQFLSDSDQSVWKIYIQTHNTCMQYVCMYDHMCAAACKDGCVSHLEGLHTGEEV